MPRSDVLTLVTDFGLGHGRGIEEEKYYDDVLERLGFDKWFTQVSFVSVTAGTPTYTLDFNPAKIIAAFFGASMIYRESVAGLEALNPNWRDEKGTPQFFTSEGETVNVIRLYPEPDVTSGIFSFSSGSPFGVDFPKSVLGLVHSDTIVDAPSWLDLPIALEVLSKEFMHQSDHRDEEFSGLCKQISDFIYQGI